MLDTIGLQQVSAKSVRVLSSLGGGGGILPPPAWNLKIGVQRPVFFMESMREVHANVLGVAMAMHTPLERSPHPHHQPVPLVVCSDRHIGHEDEEEGIESH